MLSSRPAAPGEVVMTAILGVLQFSLLIRGSRSLKDKRRVVRSVKDRLRSRYNISIAEVDDQEIMNKATLALAMAGSDRDYVRSVLMKILEQIRFNHQAELIDHSLEIL
jgi:uncharacterized protein YlxP (DUF503 family)